MTDNQKKLLLGINLLNKLLDLAENKVIDAFRMQTIIQKVLGQNNDLDMPDNFKNKVNEVLKKEQLNIEVDCNLT